MPQSAKACIASWKKYCPDYEIMQWNEDNYDVSKNRYMASAYAEKMWAFVSDYARVDIVYQHGGIYLDTDVELLKSMDSLLGDGMFAGWEKYDVQDDANTGKKPHRNSVAFGLGFGAEKGHPILRDLLALYEQVSFYNPDGTKNLTACPYYQTKILKQYGLDDSQRIYQRLCNAVVYPEDVFSPKSYYSGKTELTRDTISIHHYSMSWHNKTSLWLTEIGWKLTSKLNYTAARRIVRVISLPYRIARKAIHIIIRKTGRGS